MNCKYIVLSVILILGSCSDSVLVAQPANEQSEQIKNAKNTFDELKKALKCVFRKKGCDEKKRKEIITKGLKILGVVAVSIPVLITASRWKFGPFTPAAAKSAYESISNSFIVNNVGPKIKAMNTFILSWSEESRSEESRSEENIEMGVRVNNLDLAVKKFETKFKNAITAYHDQKFLKANRLIREAEKDLNFAIKLSKSFIAKGEN